MRLQCGWRVRWMSPAGPPRRRPSSCDTPPLVTKANDSRRRSRLFMHPIDPNLVAALTGLVSRAGEAILAIARKPLDVREKADLSPVTPADEAAQAVTQRVGHALAGNTGRLRGTGWSTTRDKSPGASFVLVDPLDGTKEFIARREEYTVNLALIEAGQPALGFVFLPARALLYRGWVGHFAERLRIWRRACPPEPHEMPCRSAPGPPQPDWSQPSAGRTRPLNRGVSRPPAGRRARRLGLFAKVRPARRRCGGCLSAPCPYL